MGKIVYILCALTSVSCAVLLIRSFLQARSRLLFWSSLAFVALAINNLLLFVNVTVVPTTDLSVYRTAAAAVAGTLLLTGLVLDTASS